MRGIWWKGVGLSLISIDHLCVIIAIFLLRYVEQHPDGVWEAKNEACVLGRLAKLLRPLFIFNRWFFSMRTGGRHAAANVGASTRGSEISHCFFHLIIYES